jgi:hypothetical protein
VRVVGVPSKRVRIVARGAGPAVVWSPTGQRLLTSVWDGSSYDLVTVPPTGGTPVPLGVEGIASSWQPLP